MMTRSLANGSSTFKIRRSVLTASGFATDVEPRVAFQLDELNTLLAKRVFPAGGGSKPRRDGPAPGEAGEEGDLAAEDMLPFDANAERRPGRSGKNNHVPQQQLLRLPLTPRHSPKPDNDSTAWANDSLADVLTRTPESAEGTSLSDYIDRTPELAQLKYGFLDRIQEDWATLGFAARTVFESYPAVTDYVIAHAFHVMKVRDPLALKSFVLNNRTGVRRIADYAAVSATRSLIDAEQLRVNGYNVDDGAFAAKLQAVAMPLSALTFEKAARERVKEFMFDRDEEQIIDEADIGVLPAGIKPLLVKMIQQSPVKITTANAKLYLPNFVLQILKFKGVPEARPGEPAQADEDFEVQFEDDAEADGSREISRSAVLCAAQLYHGMVLGEELDVFGAVNYLVFHRPHLYGGMRIGDPVLREDLQMYALDNEFSDLKRRKAGRLEDRPLACTRAAERQMFHRQVFDEGSARMPEDVPVNEEFNPLWKVLMLESARYLERAQASLNPDSYVSPQNVMQAVEDLQYNLSSACTGMATVMSPRADAELNFVMERILKHPDVVRHVVPEGGTWKQVVDKLNIERRHGAGKASTLYNKALYGKGIIEAIATYTPADFEDQRVFSDFISKVDAYITTQSILMRPKLAALGDEHDTEDAAETGARPALPPPRAAETATPGATDDWDF